MPDEPLKELRKAVDAYNAAVMAMADFEAIAKYLGTIGGHTAPARLCREIAKASSDGDMERRQVLLNIAAGFFDHEPVPSSDHVTPIPAR